MVKAWVHHGLVALKLAVDYWWVRSHSLSLKFLPSEHHIDISSFLQPSMHRVIIFIAIVFCELVFLSVDIRRVEHKSLFVLKQLINMRWLCAETLLIINLYFVLVGELIVFWSVWTSCETIKHRQVLYHLSVIFVRAQVPHENFGEWILRGAWVAVNIYLSFVLAWVHLAMSSEFNLRVL